MTWIQTSTGYVNLATARAILDDGPVSKPLSEHDRRHRFRIIDGGGKEHYCRSYPGISEVIDERNSTFIPGESQGMRCHEIWYYNDPDECLIETYPIVGWRVGDGIVQPICPGLNLDSPADDNMIRVVELPDGRCVECAYDATSWASLDAAKDSLVKRRKPATAVTA
jgi:hypothetical protein